MKPRTSPPTFGKHWQTLPIYVYKYKLCRAQNSEYHATPQNGSGVIDTMWSRRKLESSHLFNVIWDHSKKANGVENKAGCVYQKCNKSSMRQRTKEQGLQNPTKNWPAKEVIMGQNIRILMNNQKLIGTMNRPLAIRKGQLIPSETITHDLVHIDDIGFRMFRARRWLRIYGVE